MGASSGAEARQAPGHGLPGPIRPPGIIPKNRFSADFWGFVKKLNHPLHFYPLHFYPLHFLKSATVLENWEMEIPDRRWASLFRGRKRGRGPWPAGLGRGWPLRKPDFGEMSVTSVGWGIRVRVCGPESVRPDLALLQVRGRPAVRTRSGLGPPWAPEVRAGV